MEYTTKQLADYFGVSAQAMHHYFKTLQLSANIRIVKSTKTAFYSEKSFEKLKNYIAIHRKYPDLRINALIAMNDQLEKEGFQKITFDDIEDDTSGLIKDKRFLQTSFFPSYEEITPFQFQELE